MAIVVTGAAGFIGSCLVSYLNKKGLHDLILVDDFSRTDKASNLEGARFAAKIDRSIFLHDMHRHAIDFIFHMGARTDTTEFDRQIFNELNLNYSKALWQHASEMNIPFLYASSAATYGGGEHGFDDRQTINELAPLNPYGESKQDFDLWVLEQKQYPPFWVGLKFFNVFGPNEYHKGRMASVVMHAYNQIEQNGELKLFQSHRSEYGHGEQIRDFIYVKDLLDLMWFWYGHRSDSGIYNAGTGKARSFNDLANAIFKAMDRTPAISYIPTPVDIRDKYQYFTEANMDKTRAVGFTQAFMTLEDAVHDYINHYLKSNKTY